MKTRNEATSGDAGQLDAPITLTSDQIEEAAGGAALVGVALLRIGPPGTVGLISPEIPVGRLGAVTNA